MDPYYADKYARRFVQSLDLPSEHYEVLAQVIDRMNIRWDVFVRYALMNRAAGSPEGQERGLC
jgi:hypothetical protein